jgi:hypothetical protein
VASDPYAAARAAGHVVCRGRGARKEKVAIAAEPYDTKEKESIFRVDYLSHGVMPVRLIVTNNGDRPISLRDARILFHDRGGRQDSGCRARGRGAADDPQGARRQEDSHARALPNIKMKPKASNKDIERTSIPSNINPWSLSRTPRAPGSCFTTSRMSTIRLRGGQAAPAQAARRRRQRAFLL